MARRDFCPILKPYAHDDDTTSDIQDFFAGDKYLLPTWMLEYNPGIIGHGEDVGPGKDVSMLNGFLRYSAMVLLNKNLRD